MAPVICWQTDGYRIVKNDTEIFLEESDGLDSMNVQKWKLVRRVGTHFNETVKISAVDMIITALARKA
jgi:hypothetical protein